MDYLEQIKRVGITGTPPKKTTKPTLNAKPQELDFFEHLNELRDEFEDYKKKSQRRISFLEEEVNELRNKLSKTKVESKNTVEQKGGSNPSQTQPRKQLNKNKPIDRNNVAPSEVELTKIFNFSNKRF